IVQLRTTIGDAPYDEHLAVRQQDGDVALVWCGKGVGGAPLVHRCRIWIVEFRTCERAEISAAAQTTRDKYLSVGQQRGRVLFTRGGKRFGASPGARHWIIQFGGRERREWVKVAAGDQYFAVG